MKIIHLCIEIVCAIFVIGICANENTTYTSTSSQISTLYTEPSNLIANLVDPLSGHLVLRETDCTVKGAQNITLSRIYIPPTIPRLFKNYTNENDERNKYSLYDHVVTTYRGWQFFPHLNLFLNSTKTKVTLTDTNGATLKFDISDQKTTLISNNYAITNTHGDKPSGQYDIRNTTIYYKDKTVYVNTPDGTKRIYSKITQQHYLLTKEVLPNGKLLKYHYNDKTNISYVESLDRKERFVYASIRIDGSPQDGDCHFTTSNGLTVDYTYQNKKLHFNIEKKKHWYDIGNNKYDRYFEFPSILTSIKSPNYQHETIAYCDYFLLATYAGKNKSFTIHNGGSNVYKVAKLCLENDSPTYEFIYKSNSTIVKKSDGTYVVYYFSDNMLTTSIQYFDKNNLLKKEKIMSYKSNNWLNSIEIRLSDPTTLYKLSYEYDNFGNPIREKFTSNNISYEIKREFSKDGRNLLINEELENGKVTSFTYLKNTNLITSKKTQYYTEYFDYDDCCNLICKICDDGVNKITTTYVLREEPPFLHMPQSIEENNKKIDITYDKYGNVAKEDVYDSSGALSYSISKEYNERGDIISETNPSGQRASYVYDSKGDCIIATNFSNRVLTFKKYDNNRRLIEKKEEGDDGNVSIVNYQYDQLNRLIKITDDRGDTFYTYDSLTNQITQINTPLNITTYSTYDSLGRKVTKTDGNGHTTFYEYNALSLPTTINYPDGSKELYNYNNAGELISHTNRNKLTIHYTYDELGRVTSKIYDSIGKEIFTYSGLNLLAKSNLEGNVTTYSYDCIGRKIKQEFCGKVIEYRYDPLGRLDSILQDNLIINYKKDLEGRIIEQTKRDLEGNLLYKISYSYDVSGNQQTITRYINDRPSIDTFYYNSFNKIVSHQDPDLNITTTTYDNINNITQTTDPNNITTIKTYDSLNRLIKIDIPTVSCQKITYDPNGNVIYLTDNDQITKYTYTPTNKINTIVRAYNTEYERTTKYTYSSLIKTKTLPSSITLSYKYNTLGYLTKLTSSDGEIHHTFKYNNLGHLISASDGKVSIFREVDPHGNIIYEEFPNGLYVRKTYDHFDRPLSIQIANQGEVNFTYNPLYLEAIKRNSITCKYKHNLNGDLLSDNNAHYSYDNKGRLSTISSPLFSQRCIYDKIDNLITNIINGVATHYTYDNISQLSSNYSFNNIRNQNNKLYNDLNEPLSNLFDLNGNQITDENTTYSYDHLSRLTSSTSNNKTTIYTYDPLGRRLSKDDEHYIYDNYTELGAFTSELTPKTIKTQITIELFDKTYTYIKDAHNNITQLIDPVTKASTESYSYTPFGKLQTSTQSLNPWLFSSKRVDKETNLYYFGQRYYSPTSLRWLTIDPFGSIDSTNLYQYTLNNPFKYYDVNGESISGFCTGILGIIGSSIFLAAVPALELITNGIFSQFSAAYKAACVGLIYHYSLYTIEQAKEIFAPSTQTTNISNECIDEP